MFDEPLSIPAIISIAVVALIGLILLFIGNNIKKRNLWIMGVGFLLSAGVISFVESAEIRSTLDLPPKGSYTWRRHRWTFGNQFLSFKTPSK